MSTFYNALNTSLFTFRFFCLSILSCSSILKILLSLKRYKCNPIGYFFLLFFCQFRTLCLVFYPSPFAKFQCAHSSIVTRNIFVKLLYTAICIYAIRIIKHVWYLNKIYKLLWRYKNFLLLKKSLCWIFLPNWNTLITLITVYFMIRTLKVIKWDGL